METCSLPYLFNMMPRSRLIVLFAVYLSPDNPAFLSLIWLIIKVMKEFDSVASVTRKHKNWKRGNGIEQEKYILFVEDVNTWNK